MKKLILALSLLTASNHAVGGIQKQAQCYSKLLGIDTPVIIITNDMPLTDDGMYRAGVIKIRPNARRETLAHEVRHHYQNINNLMPSKWDLIFKSYEEYPHEIDAEKWALANWSRCKSGAKKITSEHLGRCRKYHKAISGDTWWSLHTRYKTSKQWLNSRASRTLKLGALICIKRGG